MCTFTEPVPGVAFDVLHPNFIWLIPAVLLIAIVWQLVHMMRNKPGKMAGPVYWAAWRRPLIGLILLLVASVTLAFVAVPTSAALTAWESKEQAVLPAACYDTAIEPAYNAANDKMVGIWFGLFILPGIFGLWALGGAPGERDRPWHW